MDKVLKDKYNPENNWKIEETYDPIDNWKVDLIYGIKEEINKKNNTCINCEKKGHLVDKCWIKNPENIRKKQRKKAKRINNKKEKLISILNITNDDET